MSRPVNTFDQGVLERLRTMVDMPYSEAVAIVDGFGIDGLRVRVAARLYARTPMMSSGDAAHQVGLRNRGSLVHYLLEHHIAPAPDDDPETTPEELRRRMEERLAHWRTY